MTLHSRDAAQTRQLGERIGRLLEPPRTVLLEGPLGSGKTVLTKGLVAGLGGDPELVTSPTFALVNRYPLPAGICYHLDLYRLETVRDLYSIGIEEILGEQAIVVVEWAEKLPLTVQHPLRIRIRAEGNQRWFEIEPPLDELR